MRRFEVVTTRSGAAAVLDHDSGEVMHPVIGARREARELYVEPSRLGQRLARTHDRLVVLDVGLGAGANALAAWRCSEDRAGGARLELISFDNTTDALAVALGSERASELGVDGRAAGAARAIVEHGAHETALTTWRVILGMLPEALDRVPDARSGGGADVVFWDPFSARANPELWTCAAFATVRRRCRPGATLHTYSAATSTRSALLLAGFYVGIGPASGAKEQTTVAAVDAGDLDHPLDARFLARLSRSSRPLPTDAPADAMRRLGSHPQLAV